MSLGTVLHSLESYVTGLRDRGVTRVPVSKPLRAQVAEPRPKPANAPVADTVLPPKPVEVAPPSLRVVPLQRMEGCGDPPERPVKRLSLVLPEGEELGESGELLREMLKAIGYGMAGTPQELSAAQPDLQGADLILAMGDLAVKTLAKTPMDLVLVRGKTLSSTLGVKLMPTFAPSYLVSHPAGKKAVWKDLQALLAFLNLDIPPWTRDRLAKK